MELNLLGKMKRVALSHIKGKFKEVVIMQPLTDDMYKSIKQSGRIVITNPYNNEVDYVSMDDVFCYGSIDFTAEECDIIRKQNYMDYEQSFIHSNFNYDRPIIDVDIHNPKMRYPKDALEWFKYNYCLIGKPKYFIVFKRKVI